MLHVFSANNGTKIFYSWAKFNLSECAVSLSWGLTLTMGSKQVSETLGSYFNYCTNGHLTRVYFHLIRFLQRLALKTKALRHVVTSERFQYSATPPWGRQISHHLVGVLWFSNGAVQALMIKVCRIVTSRSLADKRPKFRKNLCLYLQNNLKLDESDKI
jgi:hypothetical protein